MNLFHLSDDPGIARFEPRPSAYTERNVVWAISGERVANYLLPRECPRVCFRAGARSLGADVARLLGEASAVIAIEQAWEQRLRQGRLHRYAMPPASFVLHDETAGYFIAHEPVVPLGLTTIEDLPGAIARTGATLSVLPSLWSLHDAVLQSSLDFSMIRMRNAMPRPLPR